MNQNNGKGMSIAALVCGILGVVLCWVPIASWVVLVLSILGIEEVQSYRSVSGTGNCRFGLRYCWRCILSYRRYLHHLRYVRLLHDLQQSV